MKNEKDIYISDGVLKDYLCLGKEYYLHYTNTNWIYFNTNRNKDTDGRDLFTMPVLDAKKQKNVIYWLGGYKTEKGLKRTPEEKTEILRHASQTLGCQELYLREKELLRRKLRGKLSANNPN